MFRYVGVLWDKENAASESYALHLLSKIRARTSMWRTALKGPGVVVLTAGELPGDPPRSLHDGCGIVLGNLFRVSQPHRQFAEFTEQESERITRSAGRALISEFWGNYVAFLWDRTGESRYVVRGPCSTLPCLHVDMEGVDVYFSWTEACADLPAKPFSINWQYLARTLVGPLLSERTGLNEVREVLPGFCDEWRETRRIRRCYWNPVKIAEENPIEDFDAAAIELRNAARSSTHAWSTRAPRILHALSGGLDSSIVLSCLARAAAHPDVICLTHFADGSDADERPYARAVAAHLNYPLLESRRTAEVDLRGALHGIRLEYNPGMRVRAIERIEPDAARQAGATAIFRGSGGDELFCRHHGYNLAADLLRRHGLSRELMSLLAHSAIMESETLWTMLARAFRGAFIPYRWNMAGVFRVEQEEQSLLTAEILDAALASESFDLPYASSTRECPPGKLWQISLVTARRPYCSPWSREGDPQTFAPLLSQPLIETCLRIPTWFQMRCRGERAVARAAFASSLPREIIARRSKGGAENLAWKTFHANQSFIRELLLDGRLVRERIVDRRRLEAALEGAATSDIRSTVPLFDLVGAEAWLQPLSSASGQRYFVTDSV